jgi:hypothetical protein
MIAKFDNKQRRRRPDASEAPTAAAQPQAKREARGRPRQVLERREASAKSM